MARIEGRTDKAPVPGAPYAQSARIAWVVAAAGQVGFRPDTRETVSEDVAGQTRQVLANLTAALEASGASMDDVVKVGVFLAERDDFAAMNAVYKEAFTEPYPARTTVFVGLPEGIKVEIDALAVLPNGA